ncbi:MAG: PIN domain-containing protein [Prevotellaceae bacterium]|nr:PIN domain-containing protein [Candidatus Minthosoma equi]
MKIFFDTNIILEFLQQRMQADLVEQILELASQRGDELYISVGSFYTITYIIEQHLRRTKSYSPEDRLKKLRNILSGILDEFKIIWHNNETLLAGVTDSAFYDLEDSYQHQAALMAGCKYLLTINDKDFAKIDTSRITITTPQQFLNNQKI